MQLIKPATPTIPSAWYDLTVRISEAQAVAACALESLPNGLQGMQYERINTSSHLIAAVQDILQLLVRDAEKMEKQLISRLEQAA